MNAIVYHAMQHREHRLGILPEPRSRLLGHRAVAPDAKRRIRCSVFETQAKVRPQATRADVMHDADNLVSLPQPARELLADLWREVRGNDREITADRLHVVARRVILSAHQAGLQPEQLIIAVKASWSSQRGIQQASERQRLDWVLSEILTMCIEEFYRALGVTDLHPRAASRRRPPDQDPPVANP